MIFNSDFTALKVPKYRVFSGPYFPVFSPNKGKYGPEKTRYLDTFHVLRTNNSGETFAIVFWSTIVNFWKKFLTFLQEDEFPDY